MPSKQQTLMKCEKPQFNPKTLATTSDDDDDFQNPILLPSISLSHNLVRSSSSLDKTTRRSNPLKSSNGVRSFKKPKRSVSATLGKENTINNRFPSDSSSSKSGHVFDSALLESRSDCTSRAEEKDLSSSLDIAGLGGYCSSNFIGPRLLDSSKAGIVVDSSEFDFENRISAEDGEKKGFESDKECLLNSTESLMLELNNFSSKGECEDFLDGDVCKGNVDKKGFESASRYLSNSIESKLLASKTSESYGIHDDDSFVDFEPGTQLDVLMKLCSEVDVEGNSDGGVELQEANASNGCLVLCPLCGTDISDLSDEGRHVHTNHCLDINEIQKASPEKSDSAGVGSPKQAVTVIPVLEWLQNLGLSRYEHIFVSEEIDWDTLQWLTEEDLLNIGITTLGPRKKIVHALNELRKGSKQVDDGNNNASKVSPNDTGKASGNKLITEYFPGFSAVVRKRDSMALAAQHGPGRCQPGSGRNKVVSKKTAKNRKVGDIPLWCCIPGTPFRVDAFRYIRGDCSHWFLTHFHMDHYQGLTRSFCHGKIYCSLITARLVNMKIGIPWDRLEVLPLNQTIRIEGADITCFGANHCPGSIIILFKPSNGKTVLHTGDFRFSEEMAKNSILQSSSVQTLILDTTYCNPQYDFPKQEAVIQFVIEAIQAEAFNPKTLFLIGSYTIGKERLFLEVARCLRKKVYVGAAKLHLLACFGLPEEDMQWLTLNEHESHIHIVPMWTIASFKRMKHISNQYSDRFNLIVAFSPTGWTFGKGKKKSPGRRWQQGTIIRYEVPYSEHCSFTEMKEFVQFVSPANIIPSVNNDNSPESADAMIALLRS